MTDRERYLILLNATVLARESVRGARHPGANEAFGQLNDGVKQVKDGTSQPQFLRDCAEAQAVVEAHGG